MNRLNELDVSRLMYWTSRRQVEFGGFNGRTNKLIDSCYSFWIGGIFNIVNNYFDNKISVENHLLYCQEDLQKYILCYCQ
jgi:protein farnesyltransferase subunit beta